MTCKDRCSPETLINFMLPPPHFHPLESIIMVSQCLNCSMQIKSAMMVDICSQRSYTAKHFQQLPNLLLTQTNKNAPGSEIQPVILIGGFQWIPFIWYFGIIWDDRNVSHLEKFAGCCIIIIIETSSLWGNGSSKIGHYPT